MIIYIILLYRYCTTLISKINITPLCINCSHFITHHTNCSFNDILNNSYAKCKLFGRIDMVSGEVHYSKASLCRQIDNLCGKNARHFAIIK